ncbi:MAG: queuosine precursor transporter [Dehalococcoidales bacterium]|nr:queuosine precursor transporter [Dehalococcoidales bacterium]
MILVTLTVFFVTCLLVANIIAVKLVSIFGYVVPAGVIVYPLTFLFTDVITELYGRQIASKVIWIGFAASILMVILIFLGKLLPPASFWEYQPAYESILGMLPRITMASMIAYLISQHHDVFAFHFWRRKTKGKFLWLRNNASTMVSQALDTGVFITIAFWGTVPAGVLVNMLLTQYVIKLIIAVLDTPFCYILVGLLRSRVEQSMPIKSQSFNVKIASFD